MGLGPVEGNSLVSLHLEIRLRIDSIESSIMYPTALLDFQERINKKLLCIQIQAKPVKGAASGRISQNAS
jgi:hypothetical protein